MRTLLRTGTLLFFLTLLFTGCALTPVKPVTGYTPKIGEKAARTAQSLIGRPYKYRGDSPSGFDCSGLVRYCYLVAGLNVPHGTSQLRECTRSVGKRHPDPGDLLFFDERGGKYSHVGIYIGKNQFIHAPSTGKKVRKNSLLERYWKDRLLDVRRFY